MAHEEFKSKYEELSNNKKDVVAYLKKSLEERGNINLVGHMYINKQIYFQ